MNDDTANLIDNLRRAAAQVRLAAIETASPKSLVIYDAP